MLNLIVFVIVAIAIVGSIYGIGLRSYIKRTNGEYNFLSVGMYTGFYLVGLGLGLIIFPGIFLLVR